MYLYWVPNRAAVFADLLEAAFDVHRVALYRSLRWPLPVNPLDELASGEQVTRYLLRGPDGPAPTFTPDSGTHENPPAGGASPERQADTGAAGNEARSAH
jgi:hypothetical protein